jgi:hypothetical protein
MRLGIRFLAVGFCLGNFGMLADSVHSANSAYLESSTCAGTFYKNFGKQMTELLKKKSAINDTYQQVSKRARDLGKRLYISLCDTLRELNAATDKTRISRQLLAALQCPLVCECDGRSVNYAADCDTQVESISGFAHDAVVAIMAGNNLINPSSLQLTLSSVTEEEFNAYITVEIPGGSINYVLSRDKHRCWKVLRPDRLCFQFSVILSGAVWLTAIYPQVSEDEDEGEGEGEGEEEEEYEGVMCLCGCESTVGHADDITLPQPEKSYS